MTQRTETATLIKACRALEADCDVANLVSITIRFSDDIKSDQAFQNSVLSQIADRLEEQEATIRHLEVSFGKMTDMAAKDHDYIRRLRAEICNASAVAMEHSDTIKALGGRAN